MKAEFFGGPLDGDTVDFVGSVPEEILVPNDAKTCQYAEVLSMPLTPWVHVYTRGGLPVSKFVTRLEYQGYREEAAPAGASA